MILEIDAEHWTGYDTLEELAKKHPRRPYNNTNLFVYGETNLFTDYISESEALTLEGDARSVSIPASTIKKTIAVVKDLLPDQPTLILFHDRGPLERNESYKRFKERHSGKPIHVLEFYSARDILMGEKFVDIISRGDQSELPLILRPCAHLETKSFFLDKTKSDLEVSTGAKPLKCSVCRNEVFKRVNLPKVEMNVSRNGFLNELSVSFTPYLSLDQWIAKLENHSDVYVTGFMKEVLNKFALEFPSGQPNFTCRSESSGGRKVLKFYKDTHLILELRGDSLSGLSITQNHLDSHFISSNLFGFIPNATQGSTNHFRAGTSFTNENRFPGWKEFFTRNISNFISLPAFVAGMIGTFSFAEAAGANIAIGMSISTALGAALLEAFWIGLFFFAAVVPITIIAAYSSYS